MTSVPGSPPNLGNTCPHCLRSDGTHTDTCAAVAFTTNPFTSVPGSRDDAPTCCPECAHHLDTGEHADWCKTARDPEALRRLRHRDEALTDDIIEAAARAIAYGPMVERAIAEQWWERLPEPTRETYRKTANAGLAAVLPLLRAHIADRISEKINDWAPTVSATYIRGMRAALLFVTGEADQPLWSQGGQEQPQ